MAKKPNPRRMTDIDRLAAEYKRNVEAITGEYQQSFGAFQAEQAKKMEPYNLATEQYKTAMGEYESQAEAYRQRLAGFQTQLEDIAANPLEQVNVPTRRVGRSGYRFNIGGTEYSTAGLPEGYVFEGGKLFRERAVPTFTEKAPTAPTVPTMPELGEFDASAFQAKRGEAESRFKREVAERKAARLGAVSRRITRPMLQES